MWNSLTASFMVISKLQLLGTSLDTTPHLAILLSHHSPVNSACNVRENSIFFHEPEDINST